MVSWYIKSKGFKSVEYLKKVVPRTLLSKTKVFDELPVMRLRTNKDYDYSPQSKEIEIWLEYNKDTDIIFVDPKKSIRREIQLNNLLK